MADAFDRTAFEIEELNEALLRFLKLIVLTPIRKYI